MALAFRKEIDRHTSFAVWKIEETADELYCKLQLNGQEKAYLEKLNKGKRYLHWLSTRVLLRTMLDTAEYIDCQVDEYGKPFLVNFTQKISLSHSFDYAAVMVSADKQVGIDIELIKSKIARIAHKFMSNSELSFMDRSHYTRHLYTCWCAKEAVYKLQGKNNVSFLDNIRLQPFPYRADGVIRAKIAVNGHSEEYNVGYQEFDDYMIGYVAK